MEPRLIQSQSQKMILSPQIRQYLRLLQLPVAELEQAVETELVENPMLEEKKETEDLVSTDSETDSGLDTPQPEAKTDTKEIRLGELYDHLEELEDFQPSFGSKDLSREDRADMEEKHSYQESLLTKPVRLSDYLQWQAGLLPLSESEKKIMDEIIGNIDEEGYLRVSAAEIAEICEAPADQVERMIKIAQSFDPPGIATASLQEALLVQIEKKISERKAHSVPGVDDNIPALSLAAIIVKEHLPLLEKRDFPALARKTGTPPEDIKKAVFEIGKLQPHPGRAFQIEETQAVTPDAVVTFSDDEEGALKIDIPDEQIPELRVSAYYRRLLRAKDTDEKTRLFLKEKLQAAMNFLKALSLRKSTIRGITEEITKAQPEFFEKGFSHLKPLRLKDIAAALGIHESTVSRAIHGKYMATPQGMVPYKSFFSVKLETTDGSNESQKSIMEKIKQLISKEDPKHPLSDQDIVKILTGEGLVIARRTVAKYREMLKILPSHMRREK
jgi:RNA polymerase sigma-54 factor